MANPIYRELSGAVAGSQELSAIVKLYELHEEHDFDVLVLDTPPSRNALDFLDAPARLLGFLEGRALQIFLAPSGLTARLFGRGSAILFAIFARVTGRRPARRPLFVLRLHVDGARRLRRTHAAGRSAAARTRDGVRDRHFARERAGAGGCVPRSGWVRRNGGAAARRQPLPAARAEARSARSAARVAGGRARDRLAARIARGAADSESLARRDRRAVETLGEQVGGRPVLVPQLAREVQDLDGLAEVAGLLFP